jgi:hypothetical protein
VEQALSTLASHPKRKSGPALMGHTPATHHRHYGSWTDEAGLLEAVQAATGTSPLATAR